MSANKPAVRAFIIFTFLIEMKLAPFGLKLVPQRFLLLLVYLGMNYYVYNYFIYPSKFLFIELSYATAAVWSVISIIFLWSYVIVCWIDGGSTISIVKNIPPGMKEKYKKIVNDDMPICKICKIQKSSTTHHCSKCNRCYYHFDHHCHIIGNCIGFHNAQAFVIFLIYGTCSWVFAGIITFFSSYYYNGFSSSTSFVITLFFGALSYCNYVFTKLSWQDYRNNRTTYDRITFRQYEQKKISLKYPFPIYQSLPGVE